MRLRTDQYQLLVPVIRFQRPVDVRLIRNVGDTITERWDVQNRGGISDALYSIKYELIVGTNLKNRDMDALAA